MDKNLKRLACMFLKIRNDPTIQFQFVRDDVLRYVGNRPMPTFVSDADLSSPFFAAIPQDIRTITLLHFNIVGRKHKSGKRLHAHIVCEYCSPYGVFTVMVHDKSWYEYR